jgi:cytidylate kinase
MAWESTTNMLVDQACRHWERRRQAARKIPAERAVRPFSIAIAREAGSGATAIAQDIGRRLNWTVYDRDLVARIAQEMGLRANLLETLDERHTGWMSEAMQQFLSSTATPYVSESSLVRHLVETVLALGTHGECVIVGRGSAMILPEETTLRVRLVAPLKDRVARTAAVLNMDHAGAAKLVEQLDHERARYVREHFLKNPEDPRFFDIVLNTSRFSLNACADLIVDALHRMVEAQVPARAGS